PRAAGRRRPAPQRTVVRRTVRARGARGAPAGEPRLAADAGPWRRTPAAARGRPLHARAGAGGVPPGRGARAERVPRHQPGNAAPDGRRQRRPDPAAGAGGEAAGGALARYPPGALRRSPAQPQDRHGLAPQFGPGRLPAPPGGAVPGPAPGAVRIPPAARRRKAGDTAARRRLNAAAGGATVESGPERAARMRRPLSVTLSIAQPGPFQEPEP